MLCMLRTDTICILMENSWLCKTHRDMRAHQIYNQACDLLYKAEKPSVRTFSVEWTSAVGARITCHLG